MSFWTQAGILFGSFLLIILIGVLVIRRTDNSFKKEVDDLKKFSDKHKQLKDDHKKTADKKELLQELLKLSEQDRNALMKQIENKPDKKS
jgi:hypothetical protein